MRCMIEYNCFVGPWPPFIIGCPCMITHTNPHPSSGWQFAYKNLKSANQWPSLVYIVYSAVVLITGELSECLPCSGNTGDSAQIPQLDSIGLHLWDQVDQFSHLQGIHVPQNNNIMSLLVMICILLMRVDAQYFDIAHFQFPFHCTQFLNVPAFRNITLQCLTEIGKHTDTDTILNPVRDHAFQIYLYNYLFEACNEIFSMNVCCKGEWISGIIFTGCYFCSYFPSWSTGQW